MADEAIKSSDVRKRAASDVLAGSPADEDADVAGSNIKAIQDIAKEEEKRIREERAKRVLSDADSDDKVIIKMERKNNSWTTRSGVIFTQEHPFQLVPQEEVDELIREGGFRRADPKEVVYFYSE